jgi:hypothetical protein
MNRSYRFALWILMAVFVGWGLSNARPVEAAVLLVTNTNDAGVGSLRAQIAAAAPGDTIAFSLDPNSIITLTTGFITINKNLIIDGTTAVNLTISGNNTSRIFNITAGSVTINRVTLANALDAGGGGAIRVSNVGTVLTSTSLRYATIALWTVAAFLLPPVPRPL